MKKLSTKVDSIPSAGTKDDNDMLPIAGSSSHNSSKPLVVRCFIRRSTSSLYINSFRQTNIQLNKVCLV